MAKTKAPNVDGFDIVVWQKRPNSMTWCAAYTREGAEYLVKYIPDYFGREVMELPTEPEVFLNNAGNLKIGGQFPGSKTVNDISRPRLH